MLLRNKSKVYYFISYQYIDVSKDDLRNIRGIAKPFALLFTRKIKLFNWNTNT